MAGRLMCIIDVIEKTTIKAALPSPTAAATDVVARFAPPDWLGRVPRNNVYPVIKSSELMTASWMRLATIVTSQSA